MKFGRNYEIWSRLRNLVEIVKLGRDETEIFGTSGSKKSCFVSEIWPFEVGICVRAHFTMQNLGSVKGP